MSENDDLDDVSKAFNYAAKYINRMYVDRAWARRWQLPWRWDQDAGAIVIKSGDPILKFDLQDPLRWPKEKQDELIELILNSVNNSKSSTWDWDPLPKAFILEGEPILKFVDKDLHPWIGSDLNEWIRFILQSVNNSKSPDRP